MSYWARPNQSPGNSQWQPLKDHLLAVAARARSFAEVFGAGDLAWTTGLCHDLGKYSSEFQKRLGDPRIHVDHSTAGAIRAREKYGPIGLLMAYAIAGHHSGLPNGGGSEESDLFYRISHKTIPDFSAYSAELSLPERAPGLPVTAGPTHRGFTVSFFVRMLFSCLVDADALDAEQFSSPEAFDLRGRGESIGVLEERLTQHLREVTSRAVPGKVNQRRLEVLEDCLAAAAQQPGLFRLTVPTGGGKTLSSLAFALRHARIHGLDRVIYVIPFTSIIEQNAEVFRAAVGEAAVLEHHSNVAVPDSGGQDRLPSALELAEQNWDMPLVVTTNVQFFESLFSNRPSRCRKLHNIANSVVILDEAQMLPVELLSPCIQAICELVRNYRTTVVFCSATQPALERLLPQGVQVREIVRNPEELYHALKRVEVRNLGTVEDSQVVKHMLQHRQVLCIVNTRAHARKLFEQLGMADGHYHLSAAMCPTHRTKCLDEIRSRLKQGLTCRVVSTQLVEAGVDVDFPVVIRAVAGIDSVAQAAGRCNREGKMPHGDVYVFTPAAGEGMSHVWFKRTAAIASTILKEMNDPLGLDAVHRYFRDLYFYQGGATQGNTPVRLDEHGILERLEAGARKADFPFREVADTFKVIDDETVGVVVPVDDRSRNILEEVKFRGVNRNRVRRLQRYMVSVRPWELHALQEAGALEDICGLPVLRDLDAYDGVFGLVVPDAGRREGEIWIV